ncbi:hypothetical protein KDW_63540 [Dictyobacter vulcani]|uniref:Uncharacterized protein n=1 Tax=Dictyobacter vulcani TaxID=2607529 RepID=A0A5J4KYN5_9CHLR|nr:hypothetical protein KDW_63540 [Dictyobacter vulcani]
MLVTEDWDYTRFVWCMVWGQNEAFVWLSDCSQKRAKKIMRSYIKPRYAREGNDISYSVPVLIAEANGLQLPHCE